MPPSGKLLEVGYSRGQGIQLAKSALTLLLNLLLNILGELLLEDQSLLSELVLKLLLVNLLLTLEQDVNSVLVVLSDLLHLALKILLPLVLLADHGVLHTDKVVDHVDKILDNRLLGIFERKKVNWLQRRHLRRSATLGRNSDSIVGSLGLGSSSGVGESLLVFNLLEVKNSLLAEGDVFGEEIMEVVAHTRVPNTPSEADNAKNKKTEDEIPQPSEEALLLLLYRHRRRGRRCPGNVCQSSLGLANIVDGCLADSLGE
ncbi:hypothetical protein HG530_004288 [Fusarium avenaceum]|nr:hypothetical protein HG530_004288 [Fusarium avenaceum]